MLPLWVAVGERDGGASSRGGAPGSPSHGRLASGSVPALRRHHDPLTAARLPVCEGVSAMPHLPILGRNTEDAVFCGLCEWQHAIQTVEQAEHFLAEHLKAAHGRRVLYRRELETGEYTEIPQ